MFCGLFHLPLEPISPPSHNPYTQTTVTCSILVCGPFHSALTYPSNFSNRSRCLSCNIYTPRFSNTTQSAEPHHNTDPGFSLCIFTVYDANNDLPCLFSSLPPCSISIFYFLPLIVPPSLAPLSIFVSSQFWCTSQIYHIYSIFMNNSLLLTISESTTSATKSAKLFILFFPYLYLFRAN